MQPGNNTTEAACLPDGTPHPDPFLAARGWQTECGVYVRKAPRAATTRAAMPATPILTVPGSKQAS